MKPTVFACASVLFVTLAAVGCKESRAARTGVPAQIADNGLEELSGVYKFMAQNKEAPPRKLEDLAEHQAALPTAWGKIESGEYVVQWGAGYASSGSGVLAHEKKAAESGGMVLLQNGTVKEMSAAEFKSASKAR
jgi:hypothetical protein